MDVFKYTVPSRHGGTLNSHQAASPLLRLLEETDSWETPEGPQDVLAQNWGGTEQNLIVTCMVHKAENNERLKI
ncbi:uncharacterized protein TNCV_3590631 [Trichonephila clavipes]|nr:uncharacterized protein TNCV_3590631 [Trichonephila clavipes]